MSVKHSLHVLAVVVVAALSYGIVTFLQLRPEDNTETNVVAPAPLPEAFFFDKEGQRVSLENFKRSVVLVNLWATWCPPCVAELPSLDRLQAKLKDRGFRVVALSLDRSSMEEVLKFAKDRGVEHLAIYWDQDRQIPLKWKYTGLPASFLLDREGNVIARYDGPQEWDEGELFREIEARVK